MLLFPAPSSTAYRVRKLIVKHRFLVGTAATIAFLAIGGFILGFMLVQSEFSKINAELEAERARSVSAKLVQSALLIRNCFMFGQFHLFPNWNMAAVAILDGEFLCLPARVF